MSEGMRKGKVVRASGLSAQLTAGTRRSQARTAGRQSRGTRTVAKGNYVRTNAKGMGKLFASANYMMFRPNEEGETHRQGHDGLRLHEPHEVHTWLAEQSKEHQYCYRLVLSPGRNLGKEATLHWANRTLREAGHDRYMVFVHAGEKGHTQQPHVHVLLMSDLRLDKQDFWIMRTAGDRLVAGIEAAYQHTPHLSWDKWQAMQAERVAKADTVEDDSGKTGVKSKGQDEMGESGGSKAEEPQKAERQRKLHMDMDM